MARRNGEEAQDIALYHMEKLNRRRKDDSNEISKEKLLSMSPEDRRKNMPSSEWYRDLKDQITYNKNTVSMRLYTWVTAKFNDDIESMRKSGNPYTDVIRFIKSKEMDFLNS